MSTLPNSGATELVQNQAIPESAANEIARHLDAGHTRVIIEDRDLITPPGSCADGARYLIAGTGGAWSLGATGQLAIAVGTNASNGWLFETIAVEGFKIYVRDENAEFKHDGTNWVAESATLSSSVTSQSGTSYTAVLADAGTYIRFTNAAAVSFTIPPNSSVAFTVGTVIEVEQAGAGALSFVAGVGVTLNSRAADLTLAGQYAVAFAKKVATDTWTINGDL